MPNLEDVGNQINAKLDAITVATEATAVSAADTLTVTTEVRDLTVQTNALIADLDADVTSGFGNVSQGLFAILEVQRAQLLLLDHHRRQNDTIICLLDNATDLLCGISRKLTDEVATSKAILASVTRLEGIAERTHAQEAGDYDRALELRRQIEQCCPPPRPEPEPCPEACEPPRFRAPKPDGQDWKPLDVRPDVPVG